MEIKISDDPSNHDNALSRLAHAISEGFMKTVKQYKSQEDWDNERYLTVGVNAATLALCKTIGQVDPPHRAALLNAAIIMLQRTLEGWDVYWEEKKNQSTQDQGRDIHENNTKCS